VVVGRVFRVFVSAGLSVALVGWGGASIARSSTTPGQSDRPSSDCTIVGTTGNDVLRGTPGRDVICGLGGDDVLLGLGGDDLLRGGRGNDRLEGGAGDDLLRGGAAGSSLPSGTGFDVLQGDSGADRLFGEDGPDHLFGGAGPDALFGGTGPDRLDARLGGIDQVSCGSGGDDVAVADDQDHVDADCESYPGNKPPANLRLSNASVPENRPAGTTVGQLSAVDPNAGDRVTFSLVSGAGGQDNASFRVVGRRLVTGETFDFETKNSYSVRVRAADARGAGSAKTFTISVTDVAENVAPVAPDASRTTDEDTGLPIDLTALASDAETATADLTFSVTDPAHGTLTGVGGLQIYMPNANFNGTDTFTYTVTDRGNPDGCSPGPGCAPARSTTGTITITVAPVNDAPVATAGTRTTDESTPLALDLGSLVSDVETSDANLTYTIVSPPAHGTVSGTGTAATYTPDAGFNGTDSLTYQVTDRGDPDNCGAPGSACDAPLTSPTRTVSITVAPVNDAPVAPDANRTTDEDTPVTVDLSALATDTETATADLTFTVNAPSHGTLSGAGSAWTYTPAANFNGTDTFTYTVTDRGDPDNCTPGPDCAAPRSTTGTITVTVNPVNDAPVASDGSRTTDEDTPLALDLGSLVSDVETSDADLTYTIFGAPAHGTVSGSGASLTYTPAADYNGPDSLTYRVTDRGDPDNCSAAPCDAPKTSSTQTISITVNPVNDAPTAPDANRATDEDTPLSIDLAALAGDLETADADLTYTIASAPAHGTLSGSGGSQTYTPAADFNGTDTFTYTVTDRGDPDNCTPGPGCAAPKSASGTITITVNPVNDAPVNTLPAGPITALPDADTPINGLSVADVDAGTDAVELHLSVQQGTLTLNTSHLDPSEIAGNGTATVVVTASLAAINATLGEGVVFHGTSNDTLTMFTDDLGHNGSGGPKTDTDTVSIVLNSAPVAAAQSVSTIEDSAKTITLSASDPDGDASSFAIGSSPSHGTLGSIGPVTCSGATPNVCTADVTYTPDANFNGADSFTFTANDGVSTSAPATVSITVTPVNDAPSLQNIEAGALSYTENDPATDLTATTTVSDIDSANFDTGTLTVDFSVGGTVDDRLEIREQGQITVSGTTVSDGGTAIGTFTGGSGTTPLVVTLNANATPTATQDLVRAIAYRNVSDNPSTAARTARFVLTDGDGGTSAPVTRAFTVTAVNDPPTLAGIEAGALGYTENDPAAAITSSLTVTDPDSNITGATVTIGVNDAPAEDVLAFTNQNGITGSYNAGTGVLTLTGTATPANYQTALRSVTYRNTSDNPSALTRTIRFQVQDAQGATSNTVSRDVTVTPVPDAPVANADSFDAVGNTTLFVGTTRPAGQAGKQITGSVLANDTDVDSPSSALVAQPVTNAPTTQGGTISINADGSFTYQPQAGDTGITDTFTYRVCDSSPCNAGTVTNSTGTLNLPIAGQVWYVRNNAAAGGDGTSATPFDTLAEAETASGTGDTTFVFDGDNTSTGLGTGYAMDANERLIGEVIGLSLDPDGGGPLGTVSLYPATAGARPTLTATNEDVVTLASGATLTGLDLDPSGTGGGISGGTGVAGATIADVHVTDTGTAGTQPGLELDGTTGTTNISDLTVSTNGATGVRLNNAGTVAFSPAGTISISSSGARGLDATGTAMGGSTFDSITVTGSNNGGVSMTNTTGTTNFADLALTTTSGTAPAFALSNAGTVTVPAASTDNLSATGGPAADVTGTAGASLAFDNVSSTNSANDGINIAGLGAGTFSATGGTISGAAGIAFDLDGGTGNVGYAGTGASVEVTNRTGGAVTLSGNIGDGADAGGGITVSGNTGGSTTFSGATKTLNTGASTAVSLTNNTGHTISFTGGGLDIDTTGGNGYTATGGGTVAVQGAGNSVTSTTGTAVNVANTTIGTGGVTFQSVAVNGAPSGIVLNNTGTTGGLSVTGDSGSANNGSGGTIQNTTGQGISLSTTQGASFDQMNIQNTSGSGVRGLTAVRDFTFTNGTINNSGTGGGNQESSIAFNDPTGSATDAKVTGTVTITGNTLTNALWHGVSILEFTGQLDDVNISNNTITSGTTTGTGGNSFGSGIQLFVDGVDTTASNVTRAELNGNTITNFPGGVLMAVQCGTANGTGPTASCGTPGNATNDVEIKNNILNGGGTTSNGAGGVILPNQIMLLTVNGRGQGQFTVQNNGTVADPLSGSAGNIIDISAGGAVNVQATVTGNQIDAAGQTVSGTSGIAAGVGPFTVTGPTTLSTATLFATVQNNNIKNSAGSGLRLNVNAGDPTLNAIVTGNTIGAPISATYGMQVVEGNNAGFTGNANLQISNNTSTGGTGGGNTFPGIGLRKFGTASGEFNIVGLTPSPATNPQMESNVAGQNPASASGTFGTGGVAAVNGSSNNWTSIGAVPVP
jgi:hypothetical protein